MLSGAGIPKPAKSDMCESPLSDIPRLPPRLQPFSRDVEQSSWTQLRPFRWGEGRRELLTHANGRRQLCGC